MTQVLSYNVTDLSVVFFAKGRPYNVPCDHPSFATIRQALLTRQLDAEPLIELADVKVGLMKADRTKQLEILDGLLMFGGNALHGVWVEKLLAFRTAGLDYDPVFKALSSLMENPLFDARERFPIFAERNQFGFLSDGRIGAFKVVRKDFRDLHSGKFDNTPGKVVEMPREDVDANPNNACSAGLHLGALEYIGTFGHNSPENTIVFCAFWPKDVVAVPDDYNGTKMRVCRYEVIEEVDHTILDEFLKDRTTLIKGTDEEGYDLFDPSGLPKVDAHQMSGRGAPECPTSIDVGGGDSAEEILSGGRPASQRDRDSYEEGYEDGFHDFDGSLSKEENRDNYKPPRADTRKKAEGYRDGWNEAEAGQRCRF
jgi:hypothetical protein